MTSLVAGYAYQLDPFGSMGLSLGAQWSVNFIGESLEPAYGTRRPGGYMLFLRVHPVPTESH